MSLSIFGCFAMTELRGGSNLRALETVAVYHPPTAPRPPPAALAAAAGTDNELAAGDGWFELHTPSTTGERMGPHCA